MKTEIYCMICREFVPTGEVYGHRMAHIPQATIDAMMLRFPHIADNDLLTICWNHIRTRRHYLGGLCCK